ncbi:MAG: membrane protein insertase YidC [Sphingomonadaceae bacterium]|nr:membrane protein insertase YidC [Sphingomonadaceae bacterium]
MDNTRNMILAIVLSALVLIGWSALSNRIMPTANPPATKVEGGKTVALPNNVPAPATPRAVQDRGKLIAVTPRVAIRTPKLTGSINLTGARIDDLVLNAYHETIRKDSPPIRLLSPAGGPDAYYAGFGWSGRDVSVPGPTTVWQADGAALIPSTPVTLRWTSPAGQAFAIKLSVDTNYMFTVEQSVANAGTAPVAIRSYAYVSRDGKSKDPTTWNAHVGPIGVFDGKANYSVDFKDLDAADTSGERFRSTGGWIGFGDKYWLTALAPAPNAAIDAGFRANGGLYQADFTGAPVTIAPGKAAASALHFFAGAKEVATLDGYQQSLGIANFGKAIDWGWYEIVEKPIFYYLHWLFHLTGNFGLAIILLTLTVRGLLFPIAQRQFASMAGMRAVQPKLKVLQERHKDDKPRLQQEMMALYKAEKVNPLAGCLPLVIQIPIFFALYKVLVLSTEMRHQPFALWIHDLSAPDPLTPVNLFGLLAFTPPHMIAIGVLPILLGVTQYFQFKLNPQPMDPAQAQVFAIMPWVFMFIMAPFAAGLQLYWVTSNVLTIGQQAFLYSRHPGMRAAAVAK